MKKSIGHRADASVATAAVGGCMAHGREADTYL
jgi:hypothetical protein